MKKREKMTVLIAMIIITIGFGGCQVQMGGRGNQQTIGRKVQHDNAYRERLMSGKVSIEESIKKAHAK